MQLRRHKDIVAFRSENSAPIAFHARNLEVAAVSDELWNSMAPTSFDNGFIMSMLPQEGGVDAEAYDALEQWHVEESTTAKIQKFPQTVRSLTLNVTQLCNLHCTYCAAGGDGTYGDPVARLSIEKTLPQIEFFIKKLKDGETFSITFLGGEPLLYPQAIAAIAERASEVALARGVQTSFTIITNATLIDDKKLDLLKSFKPNFVISIDGPPETHDLARPQKNGKGSGELALRGFSFLESRKEEFGKITLHAVFSKSNLEVMKAYNFFVTLKADYFEFTFDITESDKSLNEKFMHEMSMVAELAYATGGEAALRKINLFNGYFNALDGQTKTENHCGSGKSLLSIDSRNKVFACPLDISNKSMQVGEGLNIDAQKLQDLESPFIQKNNCDNCWARFLCGGGCLFAHKTMTGNKHKKHFSYCERTRFLIGLTLGFYEKART